MARIGTAVTLATGLVPVVIERLTRQHPRISFYVVEGALITLQRELRERNVELLLARALPPIVDEDLELEVLFNERQVVVAGSASKWARRRQIKIAELLNEPWILPPAGHSVDRRGPLCTPSRSASLSQSLQGMMCEARRRSDIRNSSARGGRGRGWRPTAHPHARTYGSRKDSVLPSDLAGGRMGQPYGGCGGAPQCSSAAYPALTESIFRACPVGLNAGAARGIRTTDPIITKRGIGASEGFTIIRGRLGKYAVVHRRIGVPAALACVLR
jgi:LysR substrate binding domain